ALGRGGAWLGRLGAAGLAEEWDERGRGRGGGGLGRGAAPLGLGVGERGLDARARAGVPGAEQRRRRGRPDRAGFLGQLAQGGARLGGARAAEGARDLLLDPGVRLARRGRGERPRRLAALHPARAPAAALAPP